MRSNGALNKSLVRLRRQSNAKRPSAFWPKLANIRMPTTYNICTVYCVYVLGSIHYPIIHVYKHLAECARALQGPARLSQIKLIGIFHRNPFEPPQVHKSRALVPARTYTTHASTTGNSIKSNKTCERTNYITT